MTNVIEKLRAQIPKMHGINRRQAIEFWTALGGTCEPGNGNGEFYFRHPQFEGVYKCGRGKSCPRELTRRIRILARQLA